MKVERRLRHLALLCTVLGAALLVVSQTMVAKPPMRFWGQATTVVVANKNGVIAYPSNTVTPDDAGVLQRGIVSFESNAAGGENPDEQDAWRVHTVQEGDTVWGIASTYSLRPETILWSNYKALRDNPDLLIVSTALTIPPADGLVIDVEAGDTIDAIARRFKVQPEIIVAERLNGLTDINQVLAVGQPLFIRGGERELVVWQLPTPVEIGTQQVRTKRGVVSAKVYRVGTCGDVAIPPLGTGRFILPTGSNYRSGYDFGRYHGGIDFGGKMGNLIFAADSGTVVFAGESINQLGQFVGYGRYVVVDHGNGYQTLYAHNTSLNVTCGQQLTEGDTIAYMGSTGKSTGPHSHFEIRFNNTYVNPWGLFE